MSGIYKTNKNKKYLNLNFNEANYLKLDCSKSKSLLGWTPSWNITNALEKTTECYKA
tara:strand:- start:161 stop:331 length:171 start_codon:yes stop_codon:yes gene_type:complete